MTAAMSSEDGVEALPAHIRGFALLHVAMRRDARRLVVAAPAVTPATVDAVRSWWRQLHDIIDWHHRSEDDLLWPALRSHVPGFAAKEQDLHHDHTELEEAMNRVSAALRPGTEGHVLTSAALRFHDILRDHLHHEEAAVFPVLAHEMPVRQYMAVENRIIRSAPPRVLWCLQPWMFDGADRRTAARVAASSPPPVRLLSSTVLRWRYQRSVAPVTALA